MNSSDNLPEDQTLETEDEEQLALALYHGDSGELSLDARRVLVQLLAGPSLDGQRHSKLWPVLIRDEMAIRSRLSELFLQLVPMVKSILAGQGLLVLCSTNQRTEELHLGKISLLPTSLADGIFSFPEYTAAMVCR